MLTIGDHSDSPGSTTNVLLPIIFEDTSDIAISDSAIVIFQWILYTVVCQGNALFGIGTNITNIICFVKQGFKDPVNISFLGLAISDLSCLTTLVWLNISFTPAFAGADLPFDTMECQFLTGGMLHACFTRVTGWITALITLERCVCIMAPLKVKAIVTPKRVSIIVVCLFIILVGSAAPVYVVNSLGYKFYPARNRTLIGLVYTSDREKVETISYAINNTIIPISSCIFTVIFTIALVINLRKATKWRNQSVTASQTDAASNRNQKVARMVVMISTVFIACFVPVIVAFLGMAFEPKLSLDGEHRNILIIIGGLGLLFESINSSVNIFFYYNMSSKYRSTFRQLFNLDSK